MTDDVDPRATELSDEEIAAMPQDRVRTVLRKILDEYKEREELEAAERTKKVSEPEPVVLLSDCWPKVETALRDAFTMSWDGCHRIYLVMDEARAEEQHSYGYEMQAPDLDLLHRWFDESCPMVFVTTIRTVDEDAGEDFRRGFETLVPQFAE